jgi:murein L,D-transpeptidase YafK
MKRLFIWTVVAMALCAATTAALKPELLRSGADRAIRLVARISPELGSRLRLGEQPLASRLSAEGFSLGDAAFLRIFKEEHELEVWLKRGEAFALFRSYPICNWSGDLGPKLREGDGQSPEGFYAVGLRQLNPDSAYHLAFNLGFPNAYDQAHGRTGSYLMVHGDCLSIGCYAMTDTGIDDIYGIVEAALRAGQPEVPVHVFPFRMTAKNLASRDGHRWAGFWANLKEGHDRFEAARVPPSAHACGGRYAFDEHGAAASARIAAG